MKKYLSILCALVLLVAMVGCDNGGAEPANGEWKWERKVEIVCPWGAGGGADTTIRQFATQLEKVIGQSVVVNNVTGAGGVSGVQYVVNQPADGYTWLMCTPSPMLAQISGATEFDVYGNITPVLNIVWDCNIFVAGKDAPYNNYKELVEYVEKNPGKVQCGVMALTGLDGACVTAAFNGSIEAVGYSEGSQLNSDLIGNHVGLACVGPAEILPMVQSGDIKPIMVCAENRLTIPEYANTECAKENNVDCYYGPYRGVFAKNGMPEAAIKAMEAAGKQAVESEEFQAWAKSQNLDQRTGWMDTATYQAQWKADYEELNGLFGKK